MIENYFETINTSQKAYWLGFLITDGSIKCNRVILNLALKDEYIIDQFINDLDIDSNRKRYNIHRIKNKEYYSVTISLISKKMVEDLKQYKVVPQKTFVCEFPDLQDRHLNLSLLSGCFDGDGCSASTMLCSGNFLFLNQIKTLFHINYPVIKKNANVYILSLGVDLLKEAQDVYSLIERKKIYGTFYNNKNSKKRTKRDSRKKINYTQWLLDNNLTLEKLQHLVDLNGLKKLGIQFKISEKTLRAICLNLKIHLPTCLERGFQNRKCKRPDKEVLLKMLEKSSYIQVGKYFGVSDNAIRKWLKS